jgi:hypothetical protein
VVNNHQIAMGKYMELWGSTSADYREIERERK